MLFVGFDKENLFAPPTGAEGLQSLFCAGLAFARHPVGNLYPTGTVDSGGQAAAPRPGTGTGRGPGGRDSHREWHPQTHAAATAQDVCPAAWGLCLRGASPALKSSSRVSDRDDSEVPPFGSGRGHGGDLGHTRGSGWPRRSPAAACGPPACTGPCSL